MAVCLEGQSMCRSTKGGAKRYKNVLTLKPKPRPERTLRFLSRPLLRGRLVGRRRLQAAALALRRRLLRPPPADKGYHARLGRQRGCLVAAAPALPQPQSQI